MKDPYVIEVPPGTTRIDLRPALEVLALQIVEHFESARQHQGRDLGSPSTGGAKEWLDRAANRYEFTRLAEEIDRRDLLKALRDKGWAAADDKSDVRWHRYGYSWVTLPEISGYDKAPLSLTTKINVMQSMAAALCENDLAGLAREVLASRSLLDRIALESEG